MLIEEMTSQVSLDLLARTRLGRLACVKGRSLTSYPSISPTGLIPLYNSAARRSRSMSKITSLQVGRRKPQVAVCKELPSLSFRLLQEQQPACIKYRGDFALRRSNAE
jgi:hypothetical protein